MKEVELAEKMTSITINGDHVTISNGEKDYFFKLEVEDAITGPSFKIELSAKPEQKPVEVSKVLPLEAKSQAEVE